MRQRRVVRSVVAAVAVFLASATAWGAETPAPGGAVLTHANAITQMSATRRLLSFTVITFQAQTCDRAAAAAPDD